MAAGVFEGFSRRHQASVVRALLRSPAVVNLGRSIYNVKKRTWERPDKSREIIVAEILGITPDRVARLVLVNAGWTPQRMYREMHHFYKKNKRWPRLQDFKNPKTNLPTPETAVSTLWRMGGSNRDGGTGLALIYGWVVREHGSKLTIDEAFAIPNLTLRRDALRHHGGYEKLTAKIGTLIQQDDFGKLWNLGGGDPKEHIEDTWVVEVVNSTAEPNGEFLHYFLRVPPNTATAKDAVAWTFQIASDQLEYAAQT